MLTPYINYDAFVKTQKLTLVLYYLLKYRLCLIFTDFPSDVLFCSRTLSKVPWCISLVVTASVSSSLLTVSQSFLTLRLWRALVGSLVGWPSQWAHLVFYQIGGCSSLGRVAQMPWPFHSASYWGSHSQQTLPTSAVSSLVTVMVSAGFFTFHTLFFFLEVSYST